MGLNWKRLLIITVIILVAGTTAGSITYLGLKDTVEGQDKNIETLQGQVVDLRSQVEKKEDALKAQEESESEEKEEEAESERSGNRSETPEQTPEEPTETLIFYFFDPDCGTCKVQTPIVNELVAEGIPFVFMNIDDHPEYISEYGITAVPTFLINGHMEAAFFTKSELLNYYNTYK